MGIKAFNKKCPISITCYHKIAHPIDILDSWHYHNSQGPANINSGECV